MTTFRQLAVVAVISFGAAVATVSQLPYMNVGSALGFMWDIGTSSTILPITIAIILIVGLLLLRNPDQ